MDNERTAQQAGEVIPAEITAGRHLGTLITSMFLHASILHVGGNMLFLWIFGNNVEDRIGEIKFVIIYFASGIAGSLLQVRPLTVGDCLMQVIRRASGAFFFSGWSKS